ncbi:MAG TPA: hypothetical protein VEL02_07900, partial [Jatrophihabitantaceae bacterium]|nr:hypothetical protein [Jatrophihabitantaceae bacterium]
MSQLLTRTLAAFAAALFVAALLAGGGGAGVGATIEQTDYAPLYSPDGTKIAFRRIPTGFYGGAETLELWVMAANGRDQHLVTPLSQEDGAYEENAAWAPNSHALVFQQRGDLGSINSGGAIGIIDVDGSNAHTLGPGFLDNSSAPVSGDGWITFVAPLTTSVGITGPSAIELMRLDGSDRHVVLRSDDPRFAPAPDNGFYNATFTPGGKIGFVCRQAIYTVGRDGSNLTFVAGGKPTAVPGYGTIGPSFSPDGRFLAWVSASVTGVQENALYIHTDTMEYDAFGGALPGFGRLSWSPTDDVVVVGDRTRYAVVYA